MNTSELLGWGISLGGLAVVLVLFLFLLGDLTVRNPVRLARSLVQTNLVPILVILLTIVLLYLLGLERLLRLGDIAISLALLLVAGGLAYTLYNPSAEEVDTTFQILLGRLFLEVAGVGIVVVLLAYWFLPTSRDDTPAGDQKTTGFGSQLSGTELADDIDQLRSPHSDLFHRRTVKRELRDISVAVRSRMGTDTGPVAEELESGAWTSDHRAKAYFGDRSPPWYVRLRDWLSSTPSEYRHVRRVVQVLERQLAETHPDEESGGESEHSTQSSESDDSYSSPGNSAPRLNEGIAQTRFYEVDDTASSSSVVVHLGTTASDESERREETATDRDAGSDDETGNGDEESKEESQSTRDESEGHKTTEVIRRTVASNRRVGALAAFLAVVVGAGTRTPSAVFAGMILVLYAATGTFGKDPAASLDVTRTVATETPLPGDKLEVELRVHNGGDTTVSDVRLVDGVPDSLAVEEGSPSLHTALRPGDSDSVSYTLRAGRGEFEFTETAVSVDTVTGTETLTASVQMETVIRSQTLPETVPLENYIEHRVGPVPADMGGSGTEFYGVREYQHGDPLNRINWNTYAKTGELTTIQYREIRDATMVLLVDTRDTNAVAADRSELHGVDLSVYAAERTLIELLENGIQVGMCVYDGTRVVIVEPGSGETNRERIASTLDQAAQKHDVTSLNERVPTDSVSLRGTSVAEEIRNRFPSNSQVVLFSPVIDQKPVSIARDLRATDRPTTVVSPAVVGKETLGQRVIRLKRACLLQATRETGADVLDWGSRENLATAIDRMIRRRTR